MIFDNEKVTNLVLQWQRDSDAHTLSEIFEESRNLIEAIVSAYDPEYRDDMIQESYLRIHYALPYYDSNYKIHNYFTTVIHNQCRTYLKQQYVHDVELYDNVELCDGVDGDAVFVEYSKTPEHYAIDNNEILTDLIARNRQRFPSLPVEEIDDITEFIYASLRDGLYGKSRGIIANIVKNYGFHRTVATVVYHSSLVYLRKRYAEYSKDYVLNRDEKEYSLLIDLKNEIGVKAFRKISKLFSGMYVKFP